MADVTIATGVASTIDKAASLICYSLPEPKSYVWTDFAAIS